MNEVCVRHLHNSHIIMAELNSKIDILTKLTIALPLKPDHIDEAMVSVIYHAAEIQELSRDTINTHNQRKQTITLLKHESNTKLLSLQNLTYEKVFCCSMG